MTDLEIIMYIALGFSSAALIALLLGRLVWNAGVSVGTRRAQRLVPANLSDLQAERDRLKAEHAMLARKVELRLQELRMKLAEQTAEVSRNRNRTEGLAQELNSKEAALAEKEAEIARLKDLLAQKEPELASRTEQLQRLKEELRQREEANAMLARELEAAGRAIAERDRELARLKGGLGHTGPRGHEVALPAEPLAGKGGLLQRIEHLTGLSRQIEAQRRELVEQHSQYRQLHDSMAGGLQTAGSPTTLEGRAEPHDAARSQLAAEHQARIESQTLALERQLEEAERETASLKSELEQFEAKWATAMSGRPGSTDSDTTVVSGPTEPARVPRSETSDATVIPGATNSGNAGRPEAEKSAGAGSSREEAPQASKMTVPGLANVISLANRIRALQRDGR